MEEQFQEITEHFAKKSICRKQNDTLQKSLSVENKMTLLKECVVQKELYDADWDAILPIFLQENNLKHICIHLNGGWWNRVHVCSELRGTLVLYGTCTYLGMCTYL